VGHGRKTGVGGAACKLTLKTELNRSASHFILSIFMSLCSWTGIFAQLRPACRLPHSSDSVSENSISIDFRINRWDIDSAYSDNARNLHNLHRLLDEVRTDPLLSLDSLKVSAYASPDGPLLKNLELSRRRAVSLRNYLHDRCGVPDSLVSFGESSVSWGMFRDFLAASDYTWRDDALRILSIGSDSSSVDNTRRMNRLKNLAGKGAGDDVWSVLCRDIFPRLRCAYVVTTILTERQPEPEMIPAAPADTTAAAVFEEPADTITETSASQIIVKRRGCDRFAIKTNAVYLAAGVTNIGGEIAVADHWSVDLPIVYSPYTFARDYRMRFLYIQPEVRFWLDRPLKGHFFGAHLHFGIANISLDDDNRYQTPDGFYGAGISYGYSLPVAKRWSIEFTIGAGYFFTEYDTYYNIGVRRGMRYEKGRTLNYWGIDKVGINIVYRFGDRSDNRKEEKRR